MSSKIKGKIVGSYQIYFKHVRAMDRVYLEQKVGHQHLYHSHMNRSSKEPL